MTPKNLDLFSPTWRPRRARMGPRVPFFRRLSLALALGPGRGLRFPFGLWGGVGWVGAAAGYHGSCLWYLGSSVVLAGSNQCGLSLAGPLWWHDTVLGRLGGTLCG